MDTTTTIAAEVSALSPLTLDAWEESVCFFCRGEASEITDTAVHAPDCLWLRSRAVSAPGASTDDPAGAVLALATGHAHRWRTCDDLYWLARLMQEVGELGSSLVGDHPDPAEHELRQIASIAINWLRKRADEAADA